MLKVLLVDDEPFVLEGLKIMLDWEKYGFSICGEATNGEDALEIITTINPHLIITDISMPVMNGLELIKYIYDSLNLRSKVIILSGYGDFEYIKTAMKYGVVDYILKPIDEDDLDRVILKARDEIIKERQLDEVNNKKIAFLVDSGINRLIKGEVKDSLVQRIEFILEIKKEEKISLFLIDVQRFQDVETNDHNIRNIKNKIRKIICNSIPNRFHLRIFEDDYGRLCILVTESMSIYKDLFLFAQKLKLSIEKETGFIPTVTISDSMEGVNSLEFLYKQADLALSYEFFKGYGSIILFREIKNAQIDYGMDNQPLEGILEEIKCNNSEGINKEMVNLFHNFSKKLVAQEVIKSYIENLELEIVKYINDIGGDVHEISHKLINFNRNIDKSTIDSLKEELTRLCMFFAGYIEDLTKNNTKDIISEVKYYIKNNYNKNINLKVIAKQLYSSPVYLGRLFTKSTGIQFNEYLHKVRVEEAKKLLRKSNMKISDIAKSVGYSDVEYFSSKFKTFTQMSPSEYKKGGI